MGVWSVEDVAALRKMWAEGQSASEIAIALHRQSRNSVIGKVHRTGLTRRAEARPQCAYTRRVKTEKLPKQPQKRGVVVTSRGEESEKPYLPAHTQKARQAREADVQMRREKLAKEEYTLPPEIGAKPCGVIDLRHAEKEGIPPNCHWPVGDPKDPNFFYCGAEAALREEHERRKRGDYHDYCAYHAYLSMASTRKKADRFLDDLRRQNQQPAKPSSLAIKDIDPAKMAG